MDNRYLQKHAVKPSIFSQTPENDLSLVVVIPAFDEPDLETCLDSLYAAEIPESESIEILIIINFSDAAEGALVERSQWQKKVLGRYQLEHSYSRLNLLVHCEIMPHQKAGVGLARKIGMDEAVRRFESLNRDGLIVNLDADCKVEPNYFRAILDFMGQNPQFLAAGIHFEHPTENIRDFAARQAIIDYELHLRYFIAAQREVGLPFAFQTIGSCMVVRSSAYQKMGGMNIRKAGEDFYFLHKFIAINRFAEIYSTTVYPSPRASTRVPFGTGKAISTAINGRPQRTYQWKSFIQIIPLVGSLESIYQDSSGFRFVQIQSPVLFSFLEKNGAVMKLAEIRRETSNYNTFKNRFFQWFNAFRLMKFLHFARKNFPDQPVFTQALKLQMKLSPKEVYSTSEQLLEWYRKQTKKNVGRKNLRR